MFTSESMHEKEDDWEDDSVEEGTDHKYPNMKDEYEATFQPQYSTPKKPIIRSPIR